MTERKKIEITEADYEEMARLAEDVMQELYMNYSHYDREGNDILSKYMPYEGDFVKDVLPLVREEQKNMLKEEPYDELLYDLFRRGDDIGKVRYYTLEDIRPWIAPILPKALHLFRKGTDCCGETDYAAGISVPDDYLTAAFAREVRNMMMIFAGRRLNREGRPHYLLLLEAWGCRDGDEWMGIYYDDEHLREAYESVAAELEEKREEYRSHEIAIYEFSPEKEDAPCGMQNTDFRDKYIIEKRQAVRRVKPEELQCFK